MSLAVVSFAAGDLLLRFLSVFRMADNVAAEIVSESDAPDEAVASRILKMTGDADVCILSAFLTIRIEIQLVILENTMGELGLTM